MIWENMLLILEEEKNASILFRDPKNMQFGAVVDIFRTKKYEFPM